MGLRIDEVFLFVSEDRAGDEGVCGFISPEGLAIPMVCGDRARVESLREIAKDLKMRSGMKIKLLKYSTRTFVEEI